MLERTGAPLKSSAFIAAVPRMSRAQVSWSATHGKTRCAALWRRRRGVTDVGMAPFERVYDENAWLPMDRQDIPAFVDMDDPA